MAVYREGYKAIEQIEKASIRIFSDACDFGAPTKKGDALWKAAEQVIAMYGEEDTRTYFKYLSGQQVSQEFTLIDEWAVSDERKTTEEATETYIIEYVSCKTGKCEGYHGFINVSKKNK